VRTGSLIQHIESPINHAAGRQVAVAHNVQIEPGSMLASIVGAQPALPVNSSHHQSANLVGDGLRVVATCPNDGIIEALEGTSPDHFVLAVQWHPERTVKEDGPSRAIFRALVEAAQAKHKELTGEFESV
jgi:putative glutamine amidotransferase